MAEEFSPEVSKARRQATERQVNAKNTPPPPLLKIRVSDLLTVFIFSGSPSPEQEEGEWGDLGV